MLWGLVGEGSSQVRSYLLSETLEFVDELGVNLRGAYAFALVCLEKVREALKRPSVRVVVKREPSFGLATHHVAQYLLSTAQVNEHALVHSRVESRTDDACAKGQGKSLCGVRTTVAPYPRGAQNDFDLRIRSKQRG